MNPELKLLLLTGVFFLSANCFGQQPVYANHTTHFYADLIKADSILSLSRCHRISDKDSIRREIIREKGKRKRESADPMVVEMYQPKKI
jgi:hypothetical protein